VPNDLLAISHYSVHPKYCARLIRIAVPVCYQIVPILLVPLLYFKLKSCSVTYCVYSRSASEITYIVSGRALNSTHSLTTVCRKKKKRLSSSPEADHSYENASNINGRQAIDTSDSMNVAKCIPTYEEVSIDNNEVHVYDPLGKRPRAIAQYVNVQL